MIQAPSNSSFKIMVALGLISFVPFVFLVFELLFSRCYIDDGCGNIDPFVPFIVILTALAASLLTGYGGALIVKSLSAKQ
jgi:peptidoglycan/LPS O-acetylase OafA/YrhL